MTETKRTIVPVGDRVTISEIAPEERTKSGLYLPPSAQRSTRTRTGTIVAMGDGVTSKAFAVGDTVILAEFAGMEVQVDGEKLLLVTTAEVVARLKEATKPEPPKNVVVRASR